MNTSRRRTLARVAALIGEAYALLSEVTEEEREALDNTPDSLQSSDRYVHDDEQCYELEEAVSNLEDIQTTLDEICEGLA